VLDIAVASTPASWYPAGPAWNASELQAARAVYDRVMIRDTDDVPVPDLAGEVEHDEDFTVWRITVRDGATFHDGTPVTAEAVAANLDAQRTGSSADLLAPIGSVLALGDTVVVSMTTPWSTFPQVLTTQVGYIASPAMLAGFSAGPVGSGPFTYADTSADGVVRFVRNESYWKEGLPRLDAVRLVPMDEAADRVDAVLAGTVDLTVVDEPRQLSRLDDLPDEPAVTTDEDRNGERPKVAIAFDTGRPPFDHVNARRAVDLATDREELLDKVFDGQGTIARGPLSDASPWFSDHSPPAQDIGRAREEAAKYTEETGERIRFEVLVPPDPTITHIASMWRLQLAEAGIDVQITLAEQADIDAATLAGQYQAAVQVGFSEPHPDLYEPLLRGIPAEQPVLNPNVTRYVNPVVTKAFADARSTSDVARQVDDYRIVQEQLFVDQPYLFLLQVRNVALGSSALRELTHWVPGSGSSQLGDESSTVSLTEVWFAG
jgi:peptide/nickel transport system substrate-binding protein